MPIKGAQADRPLRCAILLAAVFSYSVTAWPGNPVCPSGNKPIGACFSVHGRLSSYNGNPSFRIWRTGTTRILGIRDQMIDGSETPDMSNDLRKRIEPDVKYFGDFEVCPLTPSRERHMQIVCVVGFSNLSQKKK